ncbi:MAG: hypothetical protein HON02_06110, partial [Rhodospirillaceae bacterium]|nr:hypothetical protein [Rhodospirillaceae bacterium]
MRRWFNGLQKWNMSLRGLLVLAWVLAAGGPVAAADAIVTDVRAGLQGHAT